MIFQKKNQPASKSKSSFSLWRMEILMLWPNTLYNFHMVNHHSVKWNVRIARLVVSAETRTPVQRKEINTVSVPTENLTPILHPKVWETLSTKNTFSLSGKKERKKKEDKRNKDQNLHEVDTLEFSDVQIKMPTLTYTADSPNDSRPDPYWKSLPVPGLDFRFLDKLMNS